MTRNHYFRMFGWAIFSGLITLSLTACPKKQTVKKTPQELAAEEALAKEEGVESDELDIRDKDFVKSEKLATILFDYDSYELSSEARDILSRNAAYLKKTKGSQILVEGHADERGTVGYNLALSQRRAQIVRKYYISLGLDSKSIGTLSYGKERPTCTDSREEDCMRLNRRAESKIRADKVGQDPVKTQE